MIPAPTPLNKWVLEFPIPVPTGAKSSPHTCLIMGITSGCPRGQVKLTSLYPSVVNMVVHYAQKIFVASMHGNMERTPIITMQQIKCMRTSMIIERKRQFTLFSYRIVVTRIGKIQLLDEPSSLSLSTSNILCEGCPKLNAKWNKTHY